MFRSNSLSCGIVDLFATILENPCGVGILCDNAQTGGVPVETVYGTESQSGIHGTEAVSEGVALMSHGRMNGHSAGFIKYHDGVVFKGDRCAERRTCLQRRTDFGVQDNFIAVLNVVNAADFAAVSCDSAVKPFQSGKKPS